MHPQAEHQLSSSSSGGDTHVSVDSYVASGLRRPSLARLPVGASARSRQAAEVKAKQEAQKAKEEGRQAKKEARSANKERQFRPDSDDEYAPDDDTGQTADS